MNTVDDTEEGGEGEGWVELLELIPSPLALLVLLLPSPLLLLSVAEERSSACSASARLLLGRLAPSTLIALFRRIATVSPLANKQQTASQLVNRLRASVESKADPGRSSLSRPNREASAQKTFPTARSSATAFPLSSPLHYSASTMGLLSLDTAGLKHRVTSLSSWKARQLPLSLRVSPSHPFFPSARSGQLGVRARGRSYECGYGARTERAVVLDDGDVCGVLGEQDFFCPGCRS